MMLEDTNPEDSEEKIMRLINKTMHKRNYVRLRKKIREFSEVERKTLVNKIRVMYASNPDLALKFTLYGELKELSSEVRVNIHSDTDNVQYQAINTAGELKMGEAYDDLYKRLDSIKGQESGLEVPILISMFNIDKEKSTSPVTDYLLSAKPDERNILLSNILYILITQEDLRYLKRIKDLMHSRNEFSGSFETALKKANKMIRDYGPKN